VHLQAGQQWGIVWVNPMFSCRCCRVGIAWMSSQAVSCSLETAALFAVPGVGLRGYCVLSSAEGVACGNQGQTQRLPGSWRRTTRVQCCTVCRLHSARGVLLEQCMLPYQQGSGAVTQEQQRLPGGRRCATRVQCCTACIRSGMLLEQCMLPYQQGSGAVTKEQQRLPGGWRCATRVQCCTACIRSGMLLEQCPLPLAAGVSGCVTMHMLFMFWHIPRSGI
jgi:hypothetical protein